LTICPGCGVSLPANGWTIDPGIGASAECWELLGEVQGFEMGSGSLGLVVGAARRGDRARRAAAARSGLGWNDGWTIALIEGEVP
jgi:hypothetical protein